MDVCYTWWRSTTKFLFNAEIGRNTHAESNWEWEPWTNIKKADTINENFVVKALSYNIRFIYNVCVCVEWMHDWIFSFSMCFWKIIIQVKICKEIRTFHFHFLFACNAVLEHISNAFCVKQNTQTHFACFPGFFS